MFQGHLQFKCNTIEEEVWEGKKIRNETDKFHYKKNLLKN